MTPYANLSGDSGVAGYEVEGSSIVVKFSNGLNYRYTVGSAGADAIAAMKQLASQGRGLSTFIAQHNPVYESKLE